MAIPPPHHPTIPVLLHHSAASAGAPGRVRRPPRRGSTAAAPGQRSWRRSRTWRWLDGLMAWWMGSGEIYGGYQWWDDGMMGWWGLEIAWRGLGRRQEWQEWIFEVLRVQIPENWRRTQQCVEVILPLEIGQPILTHILSYLHWNFLNVAVSNLPIPGQGTGRLRRPWAPPTLWWLPRCQRAAATRPCAAPRHADFGPEGNGNLQISMGMIWRENAKKMPGNQTCRVISPSKWTICVLPFFKSADLLIWN